MEELTIKVLTEVRNFSFSFIFHDRQKKEFQISKSWERNEGEIPEQNVEIEIVNEEDFFSQFCSEDPNAIRGSDKKFYIFFSSKIEKSFAPNIAKNWSIINVFKDLEEIDLQKGLPFTAWVIEKKYKEHVDETKLFELLGEFILEITGWSVEVL